MPSTFEPPTECGRDPMIDAITLFLSRENRWSLLEVRERLGREIDDAGPAALVSLTERLAAAGSDWAFYPRDPLARRIHHVLADRIIDQATLDGGEHLAAVADKRVVMIANHLSYSDANLVEVLFERGGAGALSNRLTVIAGPKVYSSVRRRFSSLCFGTIKTPQNSSVSSEEASMSAREVARAAHRSLEAARQRLQLGEALLVFAEGTRSRSGEMRRLLPGVARYLIDVDLWILPVGLAGTERLFPVGERSFTPVRTTTRIGRPIPAARLRQQARGDRRLIMDCIGLAIADLLPPEYRGAYAEPDDELVAPRRLMAEMAN